MAKTDSTTSKQKIPYGFCQCGCGLPAPVAKRNNYNKYGYIKGEPIRFINGHHVKGKPAHNRGKPGLSGKDNGNWKGGRRINAYGYIEVRVPDHPRAKRGYILEHVIIIGKALGRMLVPGECPHHIDGDRCHNHIGNLLLFKSNAMHGAFHARLRAYKACGHWGWRKCKVCHQWDDPCNMVIYQHGRCAYHKNCKTR